LGGRDKRIVVHGQPWQKVRWVVTVHLNSLGYVRSRDRRIVVCVSLGQKLKMLSEKLLKPKMGFGMIQVV
jgi:hypothetical protein